MNGCIRRGRIYMPGSEKKGVIYFKGLKEKVRMNAITKEKIMKGMHERNEE